MDRGLEERIQDVLPGVTAALVRCCDLAPEDIALDRRLVDDLGMESLDFIDLIYELEQTFDITIPMGSLAMGFEQAMDGQAVEIDGLLTPAARERLADVPGLHNIDAPGDISVDDVPLMLTVASICGLIVIEQDRLKTRPGETGTAP